MAWWPNLAAVYELPHLSRAVWHERNSWWCEDPLQCSDCHTLLIYIRGHSLDANMHGCLTGVYTKSASKGDRIRLLRGRRPLLPWGRLSLASYGSPNFQRVAKSEVRALDLHEVGWIADPAPFRRLLLRRMSGGVRLRPPQ